LISGGGGDVDDDNATTFRSGTTDWPNVHLAHNVNYFSSSFLETESYESEARIQGKKKIVLRNEQANSKKEESNNNNKKTQEPNCN
jgi:hypothetical protein